MKDEQRPSTATPTDARPAPAPTLAAPAPEPASAPALREPDPAPTVVELAYVPTRADAAEALRARTGRTSWAVPAFLLLGTAVAVAVLAWRAAPADVIGGVGVIGPSGVLGGLFGSRANRWWRARQLTRVAGDRGYVMWVNGNGVQAATSLMETRIPWTSFRHGIETANLFVLVVDDTVGGMVLVPKRGLRGGADVDMLRALVASRVALRRASGP
ncbi:YcxB family protein [Streptomyces sp. NPDC002566]|uniref:YcxB family protein n=1 Tax=Streptomyces sp. NPDC002566 TaxID=3364650 RepID=UPI0036C4A679